MLVFALSTSNVTVIINMKFNSKNSALSHWLQSFPLQPCYILPCYIVIRM